MSNIMGSVLKDIGLDRWPSFTNDKYFWFALLAGVATFLVIWLAVVPTFAMGDRSVSELILVTVLYYPVLEEVLFRGIIQGALLKKSWGTKNYLQISAANFLTSVLFAVAHFWYQPMLWSFMIIVPSLIFGFFRDRYGSIYPCIGLHMFYNAGFIFVNLIAQ